MIATDKLVEALEELGYETRPYSGRGMYGKTCLAISLDSLNDLFVLGAKLSLELTGTADRFAKCLGERAIDEIGTPRIDNFGMGYVAYWPKITY